MGSLQLPQTSSLNLKEKEQKVGKGMGETRVTGKGRRTGDIHPMRGPLQLSAEVVPMHAGRYAA